VLLALVLVAFGMCADYGEDEEDSRNVPQHFLRLEVADLGCGGALLPGYYPIPIPYLSLRALDATCTTGRLGFGLAGMEALVYALDPGVQVLSFGVLHARWTFSERASQRSFYYNFDRAWHADAAIGPADVTPLEQFPSFLYYRTSCACEFETHPVGYGLEAGLMGEIPVRRGESFDAVYVLPYVMVKLRLLSGGIALGR
jgi:hypothetical protein